MGMIKIRTVVENRIMRNVHGAGALDALLEKNIHADGLIGVSAEAIHGCSFVSEQKRRSIRCNLKYYRDPRYMSFQSLIRTGDIFEKDFCYYELPKKLDPSDNGTSEAPATRHYVTCTDMETGQPAHHYCLSLRGELIDQVRAPAPVPLTSRAVELDGRKPLDEGVSDSIPVGASRKMGHERTLVTLTRPAGYRKKQNPMMSVTRRAFREYPEFVEAARRRRLVHNRELGGVQRLEREGQAYVTRPGHPIKIWRAERNPEWIHQMYKLGREDALRAFPGIGAFTVQ